MSAPDTGQPVFFFPGVVSYAARIIRCGDKLVIPIAPEILGPDSPVREGDTVLVRVKYVGRIEWEPVIL